jgi:hypothetical protein
MIQVSPQTRILVAVEAVDFRNGIDGLARVCQEQLQADPFFGPAVRVPQPAAHGAEDLGL